MSSATAIGERLRALRGDRERKVVCEACDISMSALAMYETGQRIPRDEIKVKLANYFNVSIESIFFTS